MDIDKRSYKFIRANIRQDMQNMSDALMKQIFDDQESFYDYIGTEINVVFETLVNKITDEIDAKNA